MSAIKNFFKKRKQDLHFALTAGPGQRLGDSSRPSMTNSSKPQSNAPRCEPSESAKRAATAALSRLDVKSSKPQSSYKSNVMATVQQEVLAQKREEEEVRRLAETYQEQTEILIDTSPLQRIHNVQFTCELLDENEPIIGTYPEIESKIHDFLVSSLEKEPMQAGALCIHTFEKSTELRQACLDTLIKLMDNLMANPENPKFRRIRLMNKIIQQKIVAVKGAVEFLIGVGFVKRLMKSDSSEQEMEEEVMVIDDGVVLSPEHIAECKEALLNAEAIRPELCRSTTTFYSTGAKAVNLTGVELPPEFFRISTEELRKEQELRKQAVEQMGMLRTKAMREKEAQRELRRYRYCLIRIRFPDNHILQGIFFAHDRISSLISWIQSYLFYDFIPFRLTMPSGQKLEIESDTQGLSFAEMGLAPASVLKFDFVQEVLKDVLGEISASSGQSSVRYLNDAALKDVQTL